MKFNEDLTNHLISKKIISNNDREIYNYGFEMLFSTIIGYALVLIIALLLHSLMEGVIFLFSFVFLRNYTGGYHANTHFKCNFILSLSSVFVILMSKVNIPIAYLILIYFLLMVMIIFYSPVENINKPLRNAEKKIFKIVAFLITVGLGSISVMLYPYYVEFSRVIILTCFIVSLLIGVVIMGGEKVR